jgi:hypothetical protein
VPDVGGSCISGPSGCAAHSQDVITSSQCLSQRRQSMLRRWSGWACRPPCRLARRGVRPSKGLREPKPNRRTPQPPQLQPGLLACCRGSAVDGRGSERPNKQRASAAVAVPLALRREHLTPAGILSAHGFPRLRRAGPPGCCGCIAAQRWPSNSRVPPDAAERDAASVPRSSWQSAR